MRRPQPIVLCLLFSLAALVVLLPKLHPHTESGKTIGALRELNEALRALREAALLYEKHASEEQVRQLSAQVAQLHQDLAKQGANSAEQTARAETFLDTSNRMRPQEQLDSQLKNNSTDTRSNPRTRQNRETKRDETMSF